MYIEDYKLSENPEYLEKIVKQTILQKELEDKGQKIAIELMNELTPMIMTRKNINDSEI